MVRQSGGAHLVLAHPSRLIDARCGWLDLQCCSRQTMLGMRRNFVSAMDNSTASFSMISPPASPAYEQWQWGEKIHPYKIIRTFSQ